MKPRFEEHDNQLFRMLEEPVPLTTDAKLPCLVRMIQDETQMGKYNNDMNCWDTIKDMLWITRNIKGNPLFNKTLHAYEKDSNGQDSCIASIHQLEIIGYPVEEGSKEWAVQRMKLGDKVTKGHLISHIYWEYDARPHLKCISEYNCGTLQIMVVPEIWLTTAEPTGWQLYTPEAKQDLTNAPFEGLEGVKVDDPILFSDGVVRKVVRIDQNNSWPSAIMVNPFVGNWDYSVAYFNINDGKHWENRTPIRAIRIATELDKKLYQFADNSKKIEKESDK